MIIPFIILNLCAIGWMFLFIQFVRGKWNPSKLDTGFLIALAVLSFLQQAFQYYPFGGANP